MRPFAYLSTKDLISTYIASQFSTTPFLLNNTEKLASIGTNLIGNDALSFYLGNTMGRIFTPGETVDGLISKLDCFSKINLGSVIGYIVEGEKSEIAMDKTTVEIEKSIKIAAKFPHSSVSIKISSLIPEKTLIKANSIQLKLMKNIDDLWDSPIFADLTSEGLVKIGLDLKEAHEFLNGIGRVNRISKMCNEYKVPLLIDAEQTYLQLIIDSLTTYLQREHNKNEGMVLATIQSYLTSSTEKLESYLKWSKNNQLKLGVKLVRGAYMVEENELARKFGYVSPVYSTRNGTDESYNNNLEILIGSHENSCTIVVATQNDNSVRHAKNIMTQRKMHRKLSGISFGQLLGLKSLIGAELLNENYVVRKYIPFGPFNKLIPYLIRRSHEQREMIQELRLELQEMVNELKLRKEL